MLRKGYLLEFAKIEDINSWIKMVYIVRNNFPGLETSERMEEYRQTAIKNMKRNTALCMKYEGEVVGILLFSYNSKCLSCMAVHPNYRRKGIGSALIEKMIASLPNNVDISVTTFRKDDIKGIAPRQLYKKYGFEEDELVTEFDYPLQKFILHK